MINTLLKKIRILDFSTGRFGGYSTMLLSDFGAEVIKVENIKTDGDILRQRAPKTEREAQVMLISIVARKAFVWTIKAMKARKSYMLLCGMQMWSWIHLQRGTWNRWASDMMI